MSVRSARWLLFLAIGLTAPLPMLGPFDAWVPAARYLLLTLATASVAVTEGAAGPVPGILALFGAHALIALLLAGLLGWAVARLTRPLSSGARRIVVLGICGALLFGAIAFEIYRTPFGRAPTANLLEVLS